jgi:ketosteroid isomerase-like protein
MTNNGDLIRKFYGAFQQLDAETMNSCYSDDIAFFDPVFGLLQGDPARAMWRMLCKNAKDFSLTFSNIVDLDEEYSTCEWVARYTFSKTGREVVNRVKAHMRFVDGFIVEHSDAFSLHQWSRQAFGITGVLFGWNSFFQNRIRNGAKKSLLKFMAAEQLRPGNPTSGGQGD